MSVKTSMRPYDEGFYDGVLSALACIEKADGHVSGTYRDVASQCGGPALLAYAAKSDDSQTEFIREVLAARCSVSGER
jgi:hypothetical protein